MTARSLDFARRPFRDERHFLLAAAVAFALAAILLAANVRQYGAFHRSIDGTARQIESLEARRDRADRDAQASRAALNSYKVSNLALESKALLKLVSERRFSWSALLARLERTLPPDVRLTRLAPRFSDTGETTLDCALLAKSPDGVVRAITALSRDPVFSTVELRSEASPENAGGGVPEGYAFELYLRYRGNPGETP